MSDAVVIFDQVWKKFRRGERHDSLRDLLPATINRFFKRTGATSLADQEFWAVRDVSFEVKRGEALGIIGPNGAGKSTALKLLTRILRPTKGRCEVRGRVGALIEVTAGFHPDLTGRENIYLQGAIMGMKQAEIARRFDDIVEFSGVSAFIDTQVKRYSSGMQARLGFSVAAHLEPDVLFVDEVLSVGDISFQSRCTEKMQQQLRQGITIVFVSHNLQAVATLCTRCVVMGGGTKVFEGLPEPALEAYLHASQAGSLRHGPIVPHFRLLSAEFFCDGKKVTEPLRPHRACKLIVTLECLIDTTPAGFGIELERTRDLLYVYGTTSEDLGCGSIFAGKGDRVRVEVDLTLHLSRGHYRLNINVRDSQRAQFLFVAESVASFSVDEQMSYDGVVDPEMKMATTCLSPAAAPHDIAPIGTR